MKWLELISNLLGIGKGALERRSALKKAKLDSDLKVIEALADNVAIIRNGKILEYGKTKLILNNPKNDYTKILIKSSLS